MTRKIKYTNEPIGEVRVVGDFMPPPEALTFREEAIKVTLALSRRGVEFFKAEAARHQTQYQKVIRQLLDQYAERYSQKPAGQAARSGRRRSAA